MSTRRRSDLIVAFAFGLPPLAVARGAAAAPLPEGPSASTSPTDPLLEYRNRFNLGMSAYQAGAVVEAIGHWEPIFQELGPRTGYRLAYDLGIAYSAIGDWTRAAERLQTFLDEVAARRGGDQPIEPRVAREEADAQQRMASLRTTRGRIRIGGGAAPRVAQVDGGELRWAGFMAWVVPGRHTVTFAPGTSDAETMTLDVRAGELAEAEPSARPDSPDGEQPSPSPSASTPDEASPRTDIPPSGRLGSRAPIGEPAASNPAAIARTLRPFPTAVVYVGGGLTLAGTVATVVLEAEALSLRSRLIAEQQRLGGVIPPKDRSGFESTRSWAYTALGCTLGLAAATAGLATWYTLGSARRAPPVAPVLGVERGGAWLAVGSRF